MKLQNLYSQINNDGLEAVFCKHFSNELAPVLLNFYGSWESLAPWVLLPELGDNADQNGGRYPILGV